MCLCLSTKESGAIKGNEKKEIQCIINYRLLYILISTIST